MIEGLDYRIVKQGELEEVLGLLEKGRLNTIRYELVRVRDLNSRDRSIRLTFYASPPFSLAEENGEQVLHGFSSKNGKPASLKLVGEVIHFRNFEEDWCVAGIGGSFRLLVPAKIYRTVQRGGLEEVLDLLSTGAGEFVRVRDVDSPAESIQLDSYIGPPFSLSHEGKDQTLLGSKEGKLVKLQLTGEQIRLWTTEGGWRIVGLGRRFCLLIPVKIF